VLLQQDSLPPVVDDYDDDDDDDGDDAGQVSGPQKMQHIVDRNQEVLNNFIKAIEELAILRDNLLKKEVWWTSFAQSVCPRRSCVRRVFPYNEIYVCFRNQLRQLCDTLNDYGD